jgi:D-methionine transport system ATP-binding protein
MNQNLPSADFPVWAPKAATAPAEIVVELTDIRRRFGATAALDGISLSVRQGEVLGIIGRSGAGKSTLIRCLNGLERPDSGSIRIEGREITGLAERELQPLRRRVGMIFQHFNLLSAKTVEDNVALPLKIEGMNRPDRMRRTEELLGLVGLSDKAKAYPAQLSGGQKQRVGIARALAARPALLLCDEATSALDPETTRSILALLKDINSRLGLTILLITHEMEVMRTIADRIAVLDSGRIIEEGPVWRVFAAPQTETTKSLLAGIRPELPAHLAAALQDGPAGLAVLRVDAAGAAARRALLGDLAAALAVPVRLLHGGIDHIQDQPVGTFFLGLSDRDPAIVRNALAFLSAQGATAQVLGHVPDHV